MEITYKATCQRPLNHQLRFYRTVGRQQVDQANDVHPTPHHCTVSNGSESGQPGTSTWLLKSNTLSIHNACSPFGTSITLPDLAMVQCDVM